MAGRLNGRGYTVGWNAMKAGLTGTSLPPLANTLTCGPSAAASVFSASGLVTAAAHCPVLSRLSSSCTAVRVSAGVNAQCPARCTKICRSRAPRPAWSTAVW